MRGLLCSTVFWDLFIGVLTLTFGVFSGVVCWFWIRPAAQKIKRLESLLAENNARMDAARSAMLDACVRGNEEKYGRMLEACLKVYKAFQQVASNCGVLFLCRGLRDLKEIKENLSGKAELVRFGDWLMRLMPKDEVMWRHPDVLAVAQAEIFVPAKIWNIYRTMALLVGALQMQIASIHIELTTTLVDEEMIYKKIDAILPGQSTLLRRFGTAWYSNVVEELRKTLVNEIRKVVGVDPVDAELLSAANKQIELALNWTERVPEEFREFIANKGC